MGHVLFLDRSKCIYACICICKSRRKKGIFKAPAVMVRGASLSALIYSASRPAVESLSGSLRLNLIQCPLARSVLFVSLLDKAGV